MRSCVVANVFGRYALRPCGAASAAASWTTRSGSLHVAHTRGSHTNSLVLPTPRSRGGLRWPLSGSSAAVALNSGARLLHTPSPTPAGATAGIEAANVLSLNSESADQGKAKEPVGAPASETDAKPDAAQAGVAGSPAQQAEKTAADPTPASERSKADGKAASTDETSASASEGVSEGQPRGWWRRWWRSFKRESADFSLFYLPFYPATFLALYVAFVMDALHKESILDCVLGLMGDCVDHKKMHARIQSWNTWVNLGFAFVINELLEVVRFPVVVVLYYVTKPYSTYFSNWLRKAMRRFRRAPPKPASK
ncbi:hypothetical protein ABL78_2778 [Leptomonas seymouri]|uniref:DUF1279 domain-containing protein n=1 Tax=Leptomonas seymouri TaxID=5684 RepID=A0A0N1I0G0_LEPSE|nr:hypothetical protein ABL78_2778 [Leptomonas seymouri]|eukprot:KPI88145.1 hypothetical protein ABL78_2778 [Leptomonas seymouri]